MKIHKLALLSICVSPSVSFLLNSNPSVRYHYGVLAQSTEITPPPIFEEDSLSIDPNEDESVQDNTNPLINYQEYTVGSLPEWALLTSIDTLNGLAKNASPTNAALAFSILKRLEKEADLGGNSEFKVYVTHYSVVANAWAKSGDENAGMQAEEVLKRLLQRSQIDPYLTPNRVLFNCIIHAWSRQGNIKEAEEVFERMNADPNIKVETADYNAVLGAYARNGNARKAEQILKNMVEIDLEPDVISYNCILDSWRKSNEAGAAERAELILDKMQENFDSGKSQIKPNGRTYSLVASAYVKSKSKDAVMHAERLLSLAEERGAANDSYLYNSVLDAMASSGQRNVAQRAEKLLYEMEKKGTVNTVSYNTVIKAWRFSYHKVAAQKAKALLDRMERLSAEDFSLDVSPDVFTYTSVIHCYANTDAYKALELLHRMLDACKAGNNNVKPNTITLNVVLDALAKTGDMKSAEEALKLLIMFEDSCEPYAKNVNLTAVSFTSVIDAFGKSRHPDGAVKAEGVFEQMEDEFRLGNHEAKPTTITFNTLMNAWVQRGKEENIHHAEEILNRMEDGEYDVSPDVVSYSIIMNGWSKLRIPSSLEKTANIFNRMVKSYKGGNERAKPNLHSFVSLLTATVNSGRDDAPEHAEKLLRTMYKDYINGNKSIKPNAQAFTLVIDSWAKSGKQNAGERAEALLDWMLELYEKENDETFKPNQITWSVVINAWAKSRVFGKASQAKNVLNRMIKLHESSPSRRNKPNTVAYTAVINAAAYAIGDAAEKARAFQIATDTFKELHSSDYGKPNDVTYTTYITACQNLIPEGDIRVSTIQVIFKRCCNEGMLSKRMLQRLQSALSNEQLKGLLKESVENNGIVSPTKQKMAEWGRNVR